MVALEDMSGILRHNI